MPKTSAFVRTEGDRHPVTIIDLWAVDKTTMLFVCPVCRHITPSGPTVRDGEACEHQQDDVIPIVLMLEPPLPRTTAQIEQQLEVIDRYHPGENIERLRAQMEHQNAEQAEWYEQRKAELEAATHRP